MPILESTPLYILAADPAPLGDLSAFGAGTRIVYHNTAAIDPGDLRPLTTAELVPNDIGAYGPRSALGLQEVGIMVPQLAEAVLTYQITDLAAFEEAGYAIGQLLADGTIAAVSYHARVTPFRDHLDMFEATEGVTLDMLGGDDVVQAGQGDDMVYGAAGADALAGSGGHDSLWGGDGNDYLTGEAGHDRLAGGVGADVLLGGLGRDRIFGGDGGDLAEGGAGHDRLRLGTGDDVGAGGAGADRLKGGDGRDTLAGGAGGDVLIGGRGRDTLEGGAGRDTLFGGTEADTLLGGAGRDQFLFAGWDGAVDVIRDYEAGDWLVIAVDAPESAEATFTEIHLYDGDAPEGYALTVGDAAVMVEIYGTGFASGALTAADIVVEFV